MRVWIECEVKPGVFSNERAARVPHGVGFWVALVPETSLRERIERGPTAIEALVLEVTNGVVHAALPGDSATPGVWTGSVEQVIPRSAVAT